MGLISRVSSRTYRNKQKSHMGSTEPKWRDRNRDEEQQPSSGCCSLFCSPFTFMTLLFMASVAFLTHKQHETNRHLEELVSAVKRLHHTHEKLNSGHDSLSAGVDLLHSTIQPQHDKLLNVERHAKWKNVLVTGIPEKRDEECEAMVRELFLKKLKLELFEKDIESAGRTGKKQLDSEGNAKPRDIVVKLANFKDKETLLSNAGKLDGL